MIDSYRPIYLNSCVNIFYSVFTAEPWNHDWLKKEQIARYFTDMANTPNFSGFVYFSDKELVGACFGVVEDYFQAGQFSIKEIFIDSRRQHQGLGTVFMKDMEKKLAERGVKTITLITLKTIPAYAFYLKNQFDVVDGAVFMSKAL